MELLHITKKHNGKMEGMQSISTLSFNNPLCQKNKLIEGSICQKCYVNKALRYKNNHKAFLENAEILTANKIPQEFLPIINASYFRFEAFGELINETQLTNYINICKKNKNTSFALWSKNYKLILEYFSKNKAPNNLNILLSSLFVNNPLNIENFKHLNIKNLKIFTVYDKEHVKNNNIEINCGAKKCITCLKCYNKKDKTLYINEILK